MAKHFHLRGTLYPSSPSELEIAWDTLSPADLQTATSLIEDIMIPLTGLCRVPDVLDGILRDNRSDEQEMNRLQAQHRALLASVSKPFSSAAAAAEAGLQHGKHIFGFDRPSSATKNMLHEKQIPTRLLQREMDLLVESKGLLLDAWNEQHGDQHGDSSSKVEKDTGDSARSRSDLYLLLYTEFFLWSICHKVQKLLFWIEGFEASRPSRKRLVLPDWADWDQLTGMFRRWKSSLSRSYRRTSLNNKQEARSLPSGSLDAFLAGLLLHYRVSTRFMASPASGFAVRVTVATMSVAIVAFLPSSQDFYIKQRIVWGQYAISYAMQASAGQGFRALTFRVGGTIAAVCLAWISWYIVVGIPAGVLVFYWLSAHFPMTIMATRPRYYTVGTVSAFALTTILGNAMQPNGTGQSAIVLGAIRLAVIAGGCVLATFWTFFPFPISETDGAKKSLASCCAALAEYHTGFNDIVRIRLKEGFNDSPGSTSRELESKHARVFVKCNSHLQTLRKQIQLAKWNVLTDGNSFSRSHYEQASNKIDDLARNMQLMTFASGAFVDFIRTQDIASSKSTSQSLVDFHAAFSAAQHNEFGVAAMLGLFAYSIQNEKPLPPQLHPPSLGDQWKHFDGPDSVSQHTTHLADPGAATFALMRIGTKGLYDDLAGLFHLVKDLVGKLETVPDSAHDEIV